MTNTIKVTLPIDPKKWYTLYEIADKRLFRGYEAAQTVRRIINSDLKKRNILKAVVEGEANGRRYGIKGSNIIKFINEWESGKYKL